MLADASELIKSDILLIVSKQPGRPNACYAVSKDETVYCLFMRVGLYLVRIGLPISERCRYSGPVRSDVIARILQTCEVG